MPEVLIPLQSTEDTILRPVAQSVTKTLLQLLGIPATTRVRYPGALGVIQNGSDSSTHEEISFGNDSRITVTVNEVVSEDGIINNSVSSMDEPPIFLDERLCISVRPVYSLTQLVVSITYRAVTKSSAEAFRADYLMRLGAGRQIYNHGLEYHYLLPAEVERGLAELHKLRELVAGYGDDLDDWYRTCGSPTIASVVGADGRNMVKVVKEYQANSPGTSDFLEPPASQPRDEGSTWTIEFEHRVYYAKPIGVHFKYPLLVHNQPVPLELIPVMPTKEVPDEAISRSKTFDAFLVARKRTMDARLPWTMLRVPDYDDWVLYTVPAKTKALVSWMLSVSVEDPTLLFNIDAAGLTWQPEVLSFIKSEAPYLSVKNGSLLRAVVYSGEDATLHSIWIDSSGDVRTVNALSMRESYHLVLLADLDYSRLSKRALTAMKKSPVATLNIAAAIIPDLSVETELQKTYGHDVAEYPHGLLSSSHLDDLFRYAQQMYPVGISNYEVGATGGNSLTVQTTTVIGAR